jgi:hypothetical protein
MRFIVFQILLLLYTVSLFSQNNIYLGILETKPAKWPDENYISENDSSRKKIVRVVFRYQNNVWYSLDKELGDSSLYPSKIDWVISFDGKKIGELSSYKNSTDTYPRDAYHSVLSKNLHTIGEPTMEFSGWVGEAQPRPLVAVSKPFYSDPERWQPYVPDENEISELISLYIAHFKSFEFNWIDTLIVSQLGFGKSYISSVSYKLLQLGVYDTINGKAYLTNKVWFYKSNSGEFIDISIKIDKPFFGEGDSEISNLYLVDAGDYDNDGKSEIVFWIDRYSGNGYALFYSGFTKHVSFEWKYH